MKILKFYVVLENIFGRMTKNTYYPKTNDEYWNQTGNLVYSDVSRFYIMSVDDNGAMEEIWRGFSDSEARSLGLFFGGF